MKRFFTVLALFAATSCSMVDDAFENDDPQLYTEAVVESFEQDIPLSNGYCYGYSSETLEFQYFYNEEFAYWGGFAQSSIYDMEDGSFLNQYSVYNVDPASGDAYLLYYYDEDNAPCDILCRYHGSYQFTTVRLNLTTYTYKSITDEECNTFARVFGEGDYIKVSFTALLKDKVEGATVDCYVVDYRDGKHIVADNWATFDISALAGELWGIRVRIETTDVGEWGANTPLYICLDDLTYTYTITK
jgi:hypothetical protein